MHIEQEDGYHLTLTSYPFYIGETDGFVNSIRDSKISMLILGKKSSIFFYHFSFFGWRDSSSSNGNTKRNVTLTKERSFSFGGMTSL